MVRRTSRCPQIRQPQTIMAEGIPYHEPTKVGSLRRRVYEILEPAAPGDRASHIVDMLLLCLIVATVIALVVETVRPIHDSAPAFFFWLERTTIALFSAEYLLRLWSATADARFARPISGRARWAATPLAVFDLLAVLPAFLPFLGVDLRAARVLRLARLAKLGRYSIAMQTMSRVIRSKRDELVTMMMLLCLLLVVSATLLYFAERTAQPDAFDSIPVAMWWAIATLTTVGYGDMYPITPIGRLFGGLVTVVGIAMLAIPTGILGAAFVEETQNRARIPSLVCPHCGEPIANSGRIRRDQPLTAEEAIDRTTPESHKLPP
jgi:voltage-gated potassium channel